MSSSKPVFGISARRAAVASLALGALLAGAPGLALADAAAEDSPFTLPVEQAQADQGVVGEEKSGGADASQAAGTADAPQAEGAGAEGSAPEAEGADEGNANAAAADATDPDALPSNAATDPDGATGTETNTAGTTTEDGAVGDTEDAEDAAVPATPSADASEATPPRDTNANDDETLADGADLTAADQHDTSDSATTSTPADAADGTVTTPGSDATDATAQDASASATSPADGATDAAEAATSAEATDPAAADEPEPTALLTGWQTIAGHRYYYGTNGKPLTGTQTIAGKTYFFDSQGQLRTGFRYLGDSGVSFFDPSGGQQLTGQQYIHGSWRNLDATTGLSTGLASVQEQWGTIETKLYDEFDGGIQTGQQYVNGSWHYFDEDTGRMYTRWEETQRVLDVAWSYLGGSEDLAWSFLVEACNDGGNWCEYGPCISTVRHFFKAAGMDRFLADGLVDGWPHTYLDYMRATGQVSWTAYVGSIAFFDFPNSFHQRIGVSTCHAEIVVEVGDYYYKTIGSIYDGITLHTYYYGDGYTQEFGLPAYLR